MGVIDARLAALGVSLNEVPTLGMSASRSTVLVHAGIAYVSGVGPLGVTGRVGADMSVDEAYEAARLSGIYCLRRLHDALGDLDTVGQWLKVVGYVRSATDFEEQPLVVNGFSDLMKQVFGDAGACARSAIGVSELPRCMPVEVDAIIALRSGRPGSAPREASGNSAVPRPFPAGVRNQPK